MPKNKPYRRRVMVMTAVMAALLLAGVVMLRTDAIDAQSRVPEGVAGELQDDKAASATAEQTIAEPPPEVENPSVAGAMVKMVSALALVIALVYGALYLLRRLMGRRLRGSGAKGSLEVLETTYVGQHKAISLVRVGQRSVLVGVTDHQITTLTELDAEETGELVGTMPTMQAVPAGGFSGTLSSAIEKVKTIGLRKKQAALET